MIHIHGEDGFLGEMDDLPDPSHNYILLRNIRKRDGKPLPDVTDGATAFLYPWSRVMFIETMGEIRGMAAPAAEGAQGTTIIGFFREDGRS